MRLRAPTKARLNDREWFGSSMYKVAPCSSADVTVGSWLLAFNATHYDDRRMCEPACGPTSVAVYDFPKCAGLCDSITDLPRLWALPECRAAPLEPPLRPQSWQFP